MPDHAAVDRYLEDNLQDSLEELKDLCAQPSVAAQDLGMTETAQMVAAMLQKRGFQAEIMDTGGHPVVFAERSGISDKTILIYNHYDVQPAEPLELWTSPPFQPEERDGKLFGRGISDDKGHLVSRLFAIDALLDEFGDLPCRIKFIIEGEEEIGSVHLPDFVQSHQELLQADACIWEFGGVDHREIPLQHLGLRGICYVELTVKTADMDIHSGLGGSIFHNAAWRLTWALSSLKDDQEHIRLPGFYDPIIPPTKKELELLKSLPPISQEYKDRYGLESFLQDYPDETALRTAGVYEPTCTICGLTSGYKGPGLKTVMPAQASAKVDFRLVPGQTPSQVLDQLRAHLDQEGFQDVQITYLGGGPAARTDPDHPFVKLVVETAEEAFGEKMQLVPMTGASGPNYVFVHTLNLPVVTTGIGYPGNNVHAPDENIRIDLYLKGAKHIARILQAFGRS